jgi:hypothetical protein
MANCLALIRVRVPDRPGALGLVASRIGALRGDIVGIEVLDRSDGVALDELAVVLPDADVIPKPNRSRSSTRFPNRVSTPTAPRPRSATRRPQTTASGCSWSRPKPPYAPSGARCSTQSRSGSPLQAAQWIRGLQPRSSTRSGNPGSSSPSAAHRRFAPVNSISCAGSASWRMPPAADLLGSPCNDQQIRARVEPSGKKVDHERTALSLRRDPVLQPSTNGMIDLREPAVDPTPTPTPR